MTIVYFFKFLNKMFLKNKIYVIWMINWLINKYKNIFLLTYWEGHLHLINYNHQLAKCQPTKKINSEGPCLYNEFYDDYWKNPFAIKYYDDDQ